MSKALPGRALLRIALHSQDSAWFSDELRAQPPPVGSVITFKYYGLTKKGKPRFPVYLRIRIN